MPPINQKNQSARSTLNIRQLHTVFNNIRTDTTQPQRDSLTVNYNEVTGLASSPILCFVRSVLVFHFFFIVSMGDRIGWLFLSFVRLIYATFLQIEKCVLAHRSTNQPPQPPTSMMFSLIRKYFSWRFGWWLKCTTGFFGKYVCTHFKLRI